MSQWVTTDKTHNEHNEFAFNHLSPLPAFLGRQHFNRAGDQWIDAIFNINLLVKQLDIDWYTFSFVAHHVSRQVYLVRQAILPAIGECLRDLIREYSVCAIA